VNFSAKPSFHIETALKIETTRLRARLPSSRPEFIMAAHGGISTKIAEEAGFDGIWTPGLSMAAACSFR